MRTHNVLMIVIAAVILIGILVVATSSLMPNQTNNTTINNTTDNNTTNETINTSTNSSQANNQHSSSSSSKSKSSSKSNIDPDDVIHTDTFTVSENEKGQNEGMEPGTYRATYSANQGPISVEKIS